MFYTMYLDNHPSRQQMQIMLDGLCEPGHIMILNNSKSLHFATDFFDFSITRGQFPSESAEYGIRIRSRCTFDLITETDPDTCIENVIAFVGNFARSMSSDFALQSNGERLIAIRKYEKILVSSRLHSLGFPFDKLGIGYDIAELKELI